MTDWNSLRRQVTGQVLLPGQSGFADCSQIANERYKNIVPGAVVNIDDYEDIGRALRWSQNEGVPVTARGGGHSYAGHSINSGLIMNLTSLDRVTVDPSAHTVTVGGGARTGAIHRALRVNNAIVPLGNSDNVGIGGLTLGGGVSIVSRAIGLTCDALLSTDVVLADGSIITCSADDYPDLFWACRGGGGGNFGVNVSFTFRTHSVPETSTCVVLWDWSNARDVLAVMQDVMQAAPNGFSARIGLNRAAARNGIVSVIGQHLGPSHELDGFLAPAISIATPISKRVIDQSYWDAAEYLHHETVGGAFAARTRTTASPLSGDGLNALVDALDRWPGSNNPDGAGAALFTWGGAINDVGVTDTAFPHRQALFLISMDTSWLPNEPFETVSTNLEWLSTLHRSMGAFADDASYVNFADPDLDDWQQAYYGINAPQLARVKNHYDPDDVFSSPQGVRGRVDQSPAATRI